MSPAEELTQLYSQWRLLTQQEGAAIGSNAWLDVDLCQSAKARLHPRIEDVSRRIEAASLEREFRGVVNELMELERRNATLLKERRRIAESQAESQADD